MPQAHEQVRRRTPKQRRSRLTVDAICEGAAQVFERRGFAASSTNHIAERAGVSIGTLYQYFSDKEAVAQTLLERHVATGAELVGAALAKALPLITAEGPPNTTQFIREIVAAVVRLHTQAPRLHRVLFEEIAWPPAVLDSLNQHEAQLAAMLTSILGQLPGLSHPAPQRAAALVVMVVESLAHRYLLGAPGVAGPLGSEEVFIDEVVCLLDRYLFAAA